MITVCFFRVSVSPSHMPSPANHGSDERDVDLHRMFDNQKVVFGQFQDRDEHAAAHAVEQDVAQRAAARTRGGFPRQGHGRP